MKPEIFFPNLGLKLKTINRVALKVGSLNIYWYGVLIVLSIIIGAVLLDRYLKKHNDTIDNYINLIIFALINAIVCARIYYVAFSWDYYSKNLLEIFYVHNGGIAIYGAIIGIIIAVVIFSKLTKKSALNIFDMFVPYLALGQAIGRWGNFINKEAFGGYTNSLLAMAIRKDTLSFIPKSLIGNEKMYWDVEYIQVHPAFFYESICSICLFIFLIIYRDKYQKFCGEIFYLYLLIYSFYRFFVEALRTDQLKMFNIPVSQLAAISIMIIMSILLILNYRKLKESKKN